jgi:hypothetical protein
MVLYNPTSEHLKPSALKNAINESLSISGLNLIRQMQDRTVTLSKGSFDWFADAYTDSNGKMNTVDITPENTSAEFTTNKYSYSTEIAGSTTETTSNVTTTNATGTTDVVCTAVSDHIITAVDFEANTTSNRTFTVNIIRSAVTIATKTSSSANWGSGGTLTFTLSDYSDYLHTSDTYTIQTVCSTPADNLRKTAESYSGSLFSYSSQTVNGADTGTMNYTATEILTTNLGLIEHTISSDTFASNVSRVVGIPLIADWETGADINYKLTNTTEDSGWLSCGTLPQLSSFSAFTYQPEKLIVKLIPKSSGPTAGYPAIHGFAIRATPSS